MRLYIVRHGIAVEPEDHDGPDDARPLTAEGRSRTREAALGLRELDVRPAAMLASPLVRSTETAAILSEVLEIPFRTTPLLEPGARPERLIEHVAALDVEEVLVVGHLPLLDRLVALATGPGRRTFTHLGKAGAACLELGREPARLLWLLEPRMLRRIK